MAAEPRLRSLRRAARAVRRAPLALARTVRRATHAQGAGESGLGKLMELHAVNAAGDMMITVALASTIFFSVPTGEARGRVALYLLVTMAPFALLAPVIGPLLDRLPHGRRMAMAASMLTRALLALALSGAVATGGLELYPEALGVLVASKAYGVVRSAVVPRLLPTSFSLVKANSRVTLCGLLATGLAAPLGGGLHQIGPEWPLYGSCTVFAFGTFLSLTLPHKVDSAKGEGTARIAPEHAPHLHMPHLHPTHGHGGGGRGARPAGSRAGDRAGPRTGDRTGSRAGDRAAPRVDKRPEGDGARPRSSTGARLATADARSTDARSPGARAPGATAYPRASGKAPKPGLRTVGTSVRCALAANSTLRALSGLLTFFLAFLLREHPLGGLSAAVSLGLVAVAAGTGNALGTAVGAWLRARGPEVIITTVLMCALGVAVVAALLYGAVTVAAVCATAGLAQALGKLSLDALIQRDVPESGRTSAFARSETLMQMSWVVGGGIGISLPLLPPVGLWVAAGVVAIGVATAVRGLASAGRRGTPYPRVV